MKRRHINPLEELGNLLLNVEKPARYTGGEFGILSKKDVLLQTVIAFPDLYEIGMSNLALRILYNNLNKLNDVSCDRAFAPAPDFEILLREKKIPLYGLDTGLCLKDSDLLLFTMGYELGLNGVLTILDTSGIPLHKEDRNENHPIIIAGGPAVSNPLPYSPFIDTFWIGEAEEGFFDLVSSLAALKKAGQGSRAASGSSRAEFLEKINSNPHIWVKEKEKVKRAVYKDFSLPQQNAYQFPVPSMKTVQHHGVVEIMRGCPNGCRFCHAGFWYRPARQKSKEEIISLVNDLVTKGGWHEISLSSLSSGDYTGIADLAETLNDTFSGKHISFQLPSLRVTGFSLSLLEKISVTRKSGLTFAIETPCDAWQMAINKKITRDYVVSILEEAKKRGWKKAKFYFMIGLPRPILKREDNINELKEEEEIVKFVTEVSSRSRMKFNINIGIFVPKPHTPFQHVPQLDIETSLKRLEYIKYNLKKTGHKVSTSDTLISLIEGLLSRGDERAGLLCEQAFLGGSRLDAWNEYINREKWQDILEADKEYVHNILYGKNNDQLWKEIESGVTKEFLDKEFEKSKAALQTQSCYEKCSLCGVCKDVKLINPSVNQNNTAVYELAKSGVNHVTGQVNVNKRAADPSVYRMLFGYSKTKSAVFHGHLSLIEIFSMAFLRAGIPVIYTKGYNPIVKMETASPLSLGISAGFEITSVDFYEEVSKDDFISSLNINLPEGLKIEKAECYHIPSGVKKHSLSGLLWGFSYLNNDGTIDYINAKEEKTYRNKRIEKDNITLFSLNRTSVLAKNLIMNDDTWLSYFDAYNHLYNH